MHNAGSDACEGMRQSEVENQYISAADSGPCNRTTRPTQSILSQQDKVDRGWKSKVSFEDLLFVLGEKHRDLSTAHELLLVDHEYLKMQHERNSSFVVPDDECLLSMSLQAMKRENSITYGSSASNRKVDDMARNPFGNDVAKTLSNYEDAEGHLSRFGALLDRLQTITEECRQQKHIKPRFSDIMKPKKTQVRLSKKETQSSCTLGQRISQGSMADTPDAFSEETGKTMASVPDAVHGSERKSARFGVNWDGVEKEHRHGLQRASSFLPELLKSSYDYRKEILDGLSGAVIVFYVAFLGAELEILTRGMKQFSETFFIVHMIFNSFFTLELLLRLWDAGVLEFFFGKASRLNWIDLALVISSLTDIVYRRNSGGSKRILRAIRVVRIVRMVRFIRAVREVREFQKMVFAISSSMKTLFFSLIILFFILYFFAIIFAYGALDARSNGSYHVDLETYWGTFLLSIYSCFIAISTGQSWYYVVLPLSEYSVFLTLTFVGFIALVIFGVMNAITSIFVESAIMSAQYYKELIVLDKEHEKEIAAKHMREVFKQIDEDGSGEISSEEMEYFLSRGDLRSYMEALNINADDTRMLFRLLDRDNSHVIDVQEFCDGCMKLKGEARAFDIHILIFQVRLFIEKWSEFTCFVEETFDSFEAGTNGLKNELRQVKASVVALGPLP